MMRCATVRPRSTSLERTWPCKSAMIDCLPVKVRDQEYCPVTVQIASSASVAMNSDFSRTAGSGLPAITNISCTSFLLSAALMARLLAMGWL